MPVRMIMEKYEFDTFGGARVPYYVSDDNVPPLPLSGTAAQQLVAQQFSIDHPDAGPPDNILGRMLSFHSWEMIVVIDVQGGDGNSGGGGNPPVIPPVRDHHTYKQEEITHVMKPFRIKTTRETVFKTPGAQRTNGFIEVKNIGGVLTTEGIIAEVPDRNLTLKFYKNNSQVTEAFRKRLIGACGTLNSTDYGPYERDQLVIVGIEAKPRNAVDWEILVDLSFREDEVLGVTTEREIGGIVLPFGQKVGGHHHMWSLNYPSVDVDGKPIMKSKGVYFERLFRRKDYNTLGLPYRAATPI